MIGQLHQRIFLGQLDRWTDRHIHGSDYIDWFIDWFTKKLEKMCILIITSTRYLKECCETPWARHLFGWKTTFNGKRPLMEDNLRWKMTFEGRQHSMEDSLWWNISINGRQLSIEDDLHWETPFNGRPPSMEEPLQWKTTFDGIHLL